MMNKMTPSEQQAQWDGVMSQMFAFVSDTNADCDMAHDWVCKMLNISSFVDNESAWDSFYDTWESAQLVFRYNTTLNSLHEMFGG